MCWRWTLPKTAAAEEEEERGSSVRSELKRPRSRRGKKQDGYNWLSDVSSPLSMWVRRGWNMLRDALDSMRSRCGPSWPKLTAEQNQDRVASLPSVENTLLTQKSPFCASAGPRAHSDGGKEDRRETQKHLQCFFFVLDNRADIPDGCSTKKNKKKTLIPAQNILQYRERQINANRWRDKKRICPCSSPPRSSIRAASHWFAQTNCLDDYQLFT